MRPDRPRIVFVAISFHPEPGALRGLPLARWLVARGYDVRVLTAFPNYPLGKLYPGYTMRPWQWETMEGVPVLRVPIYPSHDTSAVKRILTYLSFALTASTIGAALVGPADVVYLYDPPPTTGIASTVIKFLRGARVIHHIADMWPESVTESGFVKSGWLNKLMYGLIMQWCKFLYWQDSVVTVLSEGFKRMLLERGVPESKVEVIYNWADEDIFHPAERDTELARELGLERTFNVIYAGNLGPLQDMATAVRAATLLKDHPEIRLVIIGTGPQEQAVRALAAELGVDNVTFVGPRPYTEMARYNALADVLLVHLKDLPFLRNTIPSKTQVNLASGRPVLMAVAGEAADLVVRSGGGIRCEPENPAAMAEGILKLYRMTPQEREQMAAAGRQFYESQLSLDFAGERMARLFDRVHREGR